MQVGYYDILIKIILRKKGRKTIALRPSLLLWSICYSVKLYGSIAEA